MLPLLAIGFAPQRPLPTAAAARQRAAASLVRASADVTASLQSRACLPGRAALSARMAGEEDPKSVAALGSDAAKKAAGAVGGKAAKTALALAADWVAGARERAINPDKEEARISALIADAQAIKQQADEQRKSAGGAVEELSWTKLDQAAQTKVNAAAARAKARAARIAAGEEMAAEARTAASAVAKAAQGVALDTVLAAAAAAAETAAEAAAPLQLPPSPVPEEEPTPAVAAAEAYDAPQSTVSSWARPAEVVYDAGPQSRVRSWARGVASWARGARADHRRAFTAGEQRDRLAGLEASLAVLGLTELGEERLTPRRLRDAFRARSRELHPDTRSFGFRRRAAAPDAEGAGVYELNAAYERVRKVL